MRSQKAPLEKELKYFLTKKDYEKLLRHLHKKILRTVKQTNVYFDDTDLTLRKKRIGLRIRFENSNQCTLTVKEPSSLRSKKVPKLKIRLEWECPLPTPTAKKITQGKAPIICLKKQPIRVLKKHFSKEVLKQVFPLGTVKTVRTFVQADQEVVLEIDKFKMFEKRFYELEVETHEPVLADTVVRQLLKKHKIPCRPITKSKLGRFLDLWTKQGRP